MINFIIKLYLQIFARAFILHLLFVVEIRMRYPGISGWSNILAEDYVCPMDVESTGVA